MWSQLNFLADAARRGIETITSEVIADLTAEDDDDYVEGNTHPLPHKQTGASSTHHEALREKKQLSSGSKSSGLTQENSTSIRDEHSERRKRLQELTVISSLSEVPVATSSTRRPSPMSSQKLNEPLHTQPAYSPSALASEGSNDSVAKLTASIPDFLKPPPLPRPSPSSQTFSEKSRPPLSSPSTLSQTGSNTALLENQSISAMSPTGISPMPQTPSRAKSSIGAWSSFLTPKPMEKKETIVTESSQTSKLDQNTAAADMHLENRNASTPAAVETVSSSPLSDTYLQKQNQKQSPNGTLTDSVQSGNRLDESKGNAHNAIKVPHITKDENTVQNPFDEQDKFAKGEADKSFNFNAPKSNEVAKLDDKPQVQSQNSTSPEGIMGSSMMGSLFGSMFGESHREDITAPTTSDSEAIESEMAAPSSFGDLLRSAVFENPIVKSTASQISSISTASIIESGRRAISTAVNSASEVLAELDYDEEDENEEFNDDENQVKEKEEQRDSMVTKSETFRVELETTEKIEFEPAHDMTHSDQSHRTPETSFNNIENIEATLPNITSSESSNMQTLISNAKIALIESEMVPPQQTGPSLEHEFVEKEGSIQRQESVETANAENSSDLNCTCGGPIDMNGPIVVCDECGTLSHPECVKVTTEDGVDVDSSVCANCRELMEEVQIEDDTNGKTDIDDPHTAPNEAVMSDYEDEKPMHIGEAARIDNEMSMPLHTSSNAPESDIKTFVDNDISFTPASEAIKPLAAEYSLSLPPAREDLSQAAVVLKDLLERLRNIMSGHSQERSIELSLPEGLGMELEKLGYVDDSISTPKPSTRLIKLDLKALENHDKSKEIELSNKLEEAVEELRESQTVIDELASMLAKEQSRLTETLTGEVEEHRRIKEELNAVIEKERAIIIELRAEAKQKDALLDKDKEDLLSALRSQDSIQAEYAQALEAIESLRKRENELSQAVSAIGEDARVGLEEESRLRTQLETAEAQISEIESRNDELTKQLSQLKSIAQQASARELSFRDVIMRHTSEREALEQKSQALNDELNHIKSRNSELQKRIDEEILARVEFEKTSVDKIQDLEGKILTATSELESKTEQLSSLNLECDRLYSAVSGLQSVVDSTVNENREQERSYMQELTTARNDVSRLRKESDDLSKKLLKLENDQDVLREELKKAKRGEEEWKIRASHLEKAMAELKEIAAIEEEENEQVEALKEVGMGVAVRSIHSDLSSDSHHLSSKMGNTLPGSTHRLVSNMVDRRLVVRLLETYLLTPSRDYERKDEIIDLMMRILQFTPAQKAQVDAARQKNREQRLGTNLLSGAFGWLKSSTSSSSEGSSPASDKPGDSSRKQGWKAFVEELFPAQSSTPMSSAAVEAASTGETSLADLWVNFLVEEAKTAELAKLPKGIRPGSSYEGFGNTASAEAGNDSTRDIVEHQSVRTQSLSSSTKHSESELGLGPQIVASPIATSNSERSIHAFQVASFPTASVSSTQTQRSPQDQDVKTSPPASLPQVQHPFFNKQ